MNHATLIPSNLLAPNLLPVECLQERVSVVAGIAPRFTRTEWQSIAHLLTLASATLATTRTQSHYPSDERAHSYMREHEQRALAYILRIHQAIG